MTSKVVAPYEDRKQDIVVKQFDGVNLSAHRTQIKETEFAWLENVVPLGYANMPVVPAAGSSSTTLFAAPNAAFMAYANLNGTDFMFVVKTNGSLSSLNLNTGAITNNIFAAATFSSTDVAIAQWKNERIIIVDPSNYRSWDGTFATSNGSVVAFTMTAAGAGYTSIPTITFTGGGGLGAAATAVMQVNGTQTITAAGTGYVVGDIITFSGGTSTVTAQLRVDTIGGGGTITAVSIYRSGAYSVLPTAPVAVTGGSGTGATITPLYNVASLTLTNPGTTAYIAAPTVVFTGGGFTSAATPTPPIVAGLSAGHAVATYAGRVWVAKGRTRNYSAPDSWYDFSAATAGGSSIISDETLEKNINQLIAANGFLYTVGDTSIDALSDVRVQAGSPPITVFSSVNISPQIGSQFGPGNPLIPFGKALLWSARFGIYSLLGSTPRKLSDKLDLLMKAVTVSGGQFLGAGVCKLYGSLCPAFLVSYPDGSVAGTRTLVVMLVNGRWFFVTQGTPTLIAGATVSGDQVLFASDGTNIYQLFGETTNASTIAWKITTALWPAKTPVSDKQMFKCGVEISPLENSIVSITTPITDIPATINVLLDNERSGTSPQIVLGPNTGQWVNAAGVSGSWVNAAGQSGDWLLPGFNILQADASTKGRYVGYTMIGSTRGFTFNGILGQYEERGKWNASGVS